MSPTPLNQVPDAELLLAVSRGDEESFAELYRRYERPAFSLAYRLTGSYEAAEDSVQRAFFRIWSSAGRFLADGNPRGWILKILARESMVSLKGLRRQKALHDRELAKTVAEARGFAPEVPERQEIHQALQAQLDRLPEEMHRLMALYFGAGLSQHEIGRILALPQRTVSNRLNLALERVRIGLVAAGFAEARLAVDFGSLSTAVLSGVEVPAGLGPRIFEQLRLRHRLRGLDSGALGLGKMGGTLAALIAVASGTLLWMDSGSPEHQEGTGSGAGGGSLTGVAKSIPGGERPYQRSWDFNVPDGWRDLRVVLGNWRWLAGAGQDRSGCLETAAEVTWVELPAPPDAAPFWIGWQERCLEPGLLEGIGAKANWSNWESAASLKGISHRTVFDVWQERVDYLALDRADHWVNGSRSSLTWYDRGKEKVRIVIWGKVLLDNLAIRAISPLDLPDASLYLHAVQGLEPARRQGLVPLTGVPSARPARPVMAVFPAGETSWDFEQEPPANVKILDGAWNRESTPLPARMRTGPAGVLVLIQENISQLEMYSAKVRATVRENGARAGAFLVQGPKPCSFKEWLEGRKELVPGSRHLFQSIVKDALVFDFVDGQLVRVRKFADAYRPPYFLSSAALKLEGLDIERIGFQTVGMGDLPRSARDWNPPQDNDRHPRCR